VPHEVYAFGDSHWRVFFPFLNTGSPGVCYEQSGIVTLDTTGSELSGATMWGLMNPTSRQGARRRILATLDDKSGVDSVGLVFGEVDVRFHNRRYFVDDDRISIGSVYELISRYKRFIDEDLLLSGRVRHHVFIYYGFRYPLGERTPPFSGSKEDRDTLFRMGFLNEVIETIMPEMLTFGPHRDRIHTIFPGHEAVEGVSDDGVHLRPEVAYNQWVFPAMKAAIG
jgi:hypothetical protein